MQQFVEQCTLEGAQKGAGSSVEGTAPSTPIPQLSYPACRRTRLNPALRGDVALRDWGCGDSECLSLGLREMRPCLQEVGAGIPRWRGCRRRTAACTAPGVAQRSIFSGNMQVQGEPQPPSVLTDIQQFVLMGLGNGDPLTEEAGGI